jgi:hypothetical protein
MSRVDPRKRDPSQQRNTTRPLSPRRKQACNTEGLRPVERPSQGPHHNAMAVRLGLCRPRPHHQQDGLIVNGVFPLLGRARMAFARSLTDGRAGRQTKDRQTDLGGSERRPCHSSCVTSAHRAATLTLPSSSASSPPATASSRMPAATARRRAAIWTASSPPPASRRGSASAPAKACAACGGAPPAALSTPASRRPKMPCSPAAARSRGPARTARRCAVVC